MKHPVVIISAIAGIVVLSLAAPEVGLPVGLAALVAWLAEKKS
jgi:hypothetical protein